MAQLPTQPPKMQPTLERVLAQVKTYENGGVQILRLHVAAFGQLPELEVTRSTFERAWAIAGKPELEPMRGNAIHRFTAANLSVKAYRDAVE